MNTNVAAIAAFTPVFIPVHPPEKISPHHTTRAQLISRLRHTQLLLRAPQRLRRQGISPPQLRKQSRSRSRHHHRSQPANHHRSYRAPPLRRQSALKLTKLIRSPNEQPVHRTHSPTHLLRRSQLQNARPDYDTHHIASTHEHQRHQAHPHALRQPEHHCSRPKDPHTCQHHRTGAPLDRLHQHRQRNRQRP